MHDITGEFSLAIHRVEHLGIMGWILVLLLQYLAALLYRKVWPN